MACRNCEMHSVDIEKGICSDSCVQGFLHGTNLGMNGDGSTLLSWLLCFYCSARTRLTHCFSAGFSSQMNSGSCTYYLLPILFPVCCPVRFTWKNFWISGRNVTRRLPFIRSLLIRVFWRLFFFFFFFPMNDLKLLKCLFLLNWN